MKNIIDCEDQIILTADRIRAVLEMMVETNAHTVSGTRLSILGGMLLDMQEELMAAVEEIEAIAERVDGEKDGRTN